MKTQQQTQNQQKRKTVTCHKLYNTCACWQWKFECVVRYQIWGTFDLCSDDSDRLMNLQNKHLVYNLLWVLEWIFLKMSTQKSVSAATTRSSAALPIPPAMADTTLSVGMIDIHHGWWLTSALCSCKVYHATQKLQSLIDIPYIKTHLQQLPFCSNLTFTHPHHKQVVWHLWCRLFQHFSIVLACDANGKCQVWMERWLL